MFKFLCKKLTVIQTEIEWIWTCAFIVVCSQTLRGDWDSAKPVFGARIRSERRAVRLSCDARANEGKGSSWEIPTGSYLAMHQATVSVMYYDCLFSTASEHPCLSTGDALAFRVFSSWPVSWPAASASALVRARLASTSCGSFALATLAIGTLRVAHAFESIHIHDSRSRCSASSCVGRFGPQRIVNQSACSDCRTWRLVVGIRCVRLSLLIQTGWLPMPFSVSFHSTSRLSRHPPLALLRSFTLRSFQFLFNSFVFSTSISFAFHFTRRSLSPRFLFCFLLPRFFCRVMSSHYLPLDFTSNWQSVLLFLLPVSNQRCR